MNMLIVDDDIVALKSVMSGIKWKECGIDGTVWMASNAKQAEEILERETVDIILCDIEMPGINGIELIQKVHKENPDISVIFLTCHANFEYAKEAIALGCKDYILTPSPFEAIGVAVKSAANEIWKKRKKNDMERLGSLWLSQQEKKLENSQGRSKNAAEIINDTVDFILANLDSEELSVIALANRTFLHEDYLNRIFKREKQMSINQYIIQERMKLAAKLLHNATLRASVIANHVGYSNYSYFVSAFKKVYGQTPAQYRRKSLGMDE